MKNPITTIAGLVMILLSGLTLFGVITQEESAAFADYATILVEAIVGIIALIAKDKGGGL